jgi:hypothetical protein
MLAYSLPTSKLDILPVPDVNFIYNYTLLFPNITEFAVDFTIDNSNSYNYQIWFNHTLTFNNTDSFNTRLLSLTRALDEAICSFSLM